jgi:hypothetical protein
LGFGCSGYADESAVKRNGYLLLGRGVDGEVFGRLYTTQVPKNIKKTQKNKVGGQMMDDARQKKKHHGRWWFCLLTVRRGS